MPKKIKNDSPKVGDVHITTNQRLKNYYKKPPQSNKRMVVVVDNKKDKTVVRGVVSDNKKNRATLSKKGYDKLSKKRNKFLKNDSLVSMEKHTDIYKTKSERSRGSSNKKNIDLSDRKVFSDKVGRIHWKDKKKIKKSSK